ncbi:MAG: peptidylprolyl isomerase [Vicingaceae bacterium]
MKRWWTIPLLMLSFPVILIGQNIVIDEVIAVVGSEVLLKSDFEKNLIQYKSQGTIVDDDLRCQVLEDLLFQKLLLNQAKLDSIEITDKQIDQELDRRIKYFISQIGSERALEEYYKKSMAEIKAELRGNLKDQMIIQRMQSEVTMDMDITPSEVKKFYNEIPKDSLPLINDQVELAQIVILAPPNRQQIEDARSRLNELRERVVQGEDFATLAILYSEDPGTAKQGGELGFVGRAEVDPAFAETAFKLKGREVSRIVKSTFGLHIIQLIDKQGEKVNVRHILVKPKIEGAEILRSKEICDSVGLAIYRYDTLSFQEAAIRHSEDEETKNSGGLMVNPYSGSSMFEFDQLDPSVYTAIQNLREGELSESTAYSTRDGKKGYSLYYVSKKVEGHRANLEQDYQLIQEFTLQKKQESVVRKWIDEKLHDTYSHLNEDYQNCKFENSWEKIN